MKKGAHPKYQKVLFVDSASGYRFVCGSTLQTEAKEVFEGVEYPVSYLSISSASHPFFTGSKQLVDSEGRVEKFRKRFGKGAFNQDINQDAFSQDQSKKDQQEDEPKEKPKAAVSAKNAAPKQQASKAPAKAPAKPAAKAPAKPAAKAPAKKK